MRVLFVGQKRAGLGDICNIAPDDDGIATLEKKLASTTYDCVVVGGGLRLPPKDSPPVLTHHSPEETAMIASAALVT
jgi:hypothetical protein